MSTIALLDRMDRALTAASPVAVAMLGISSTYYVAFSYGLGVIALLFGKEGASQVRYVVECRLCIGKEELSDGKETGNPQNV